MAKSVVLRSAVPDDARALTALALRSKAYWGYDDAFMKACVNELTITPERIAGEDMTVAEADGVIAGMVSLAQGDSDDVRELEDMFVDTGFIGSGLGARLMAHAEDTARAQGAAHIDVDADPNAQGFYEKCGYRLTGTSPSASIPGRMLPRLRLDL
ncbi:MAG: GNAT family N-acetyltransferase [Parvibaculaceae bacterium]|nr:GNAT family N-acetyltransferase [Parvibaculaceae bacterium]HBM88168.1 GNAT family N-acetyltransferase [Rhodobiaceae bacterium]